MRKIFLAGHNGMVGKSIHKALKSDTNIEIIVRSKDELNLCNQDDVKNFFLKEKPAEVIIAAAKVGGIYANSTFPADFIYENLQIQNNIIHSAHISDIQKILFLGSSCIYPKYAKQPITEEELLTGVLEPTNEAYAIAKIAGIKMCESYNIQYQRDYRSIMPTNLYGPGDNYDKNNSHVVPALLRRFHEAKVNNLAEVKVWGSGKPKREFLYVDDMASASLFVHNLPKDLYKLKTSPSISHINVGSGNDISISDLAYEIKNVVGFNGKIRFDKTKPDGTPRKLMSSNLIKSLGWESKISLLDGLKTTYKFFLKEHL